MDDILKKIIVYHNYPCNLISDIYYKREGYIHGKHTSYYQNGNINRICKWENGQKHGWSIYYREDGTIYNREYYQNGIELKDYYMKLNRLIED